MEPPVFILLVQASAVFFRKLLQHPLSRGRSVQIIPVKLQIMQSFRKPRQNVILSIKIAFDSHLNFIPHFYFCKVMFLQFFAYFCR